MKCEATILNAALSIALFCLSFCLVWQVSATNQFLYSTWYDVLDIGSTIKQYAPKNKYKHGFENTEKRQHVELFSGIVDAISDQGTGLTELSYTDLKTKKNHTLLTQDEVVHLQDVANLVDKFIYLAIAGFVLAMITYFIMRFRKVSVATLKNQLLGGISIIALITILILIVGPTKIFYWGHELVFPNNHQWFFYYEDSLMSTMMKAPVLFGPIACQLLVLTLLLWFLLLYALQKINRKFKTA